MSKAYDTLADPEKRSLYDRMGEEGINGAGGGSDFNAEDHFAHFFGGSFFGGGAGGRSRRPAKGKDIVHELKSVVEQYKSSEKDIMKTFKLETSSESIYVGIDQYKFSQAINNLISNAIKFTHDNGIIVVGIEEKEETVLITVEDNGIGIPANRQEGLFEKFTKARRPGIKGEPSVGLGMSIIKTIVEWHNGKIWFESEENVGSKFFIEIPKE